MSFASLRLSLVAGAAASLCLATTGVSQAAPPAEPSARPAHAERHWDPAESRTHMAEHLRAVLQLQPGQDAALSAFVDALQPAAGMGDHMDMDMDGDEADEHLTTPQRLDRMQAHMDAMRARFTTVAEATKRFYAQLTPSQQKAFDELGPMMLMHHLVGGHHEGMEGRHGGDHGEHMMGPDRPPHS